MTQPKKTWQISATSISTFKRCPMEYYYKYILGLRPIVETDALRVGSNWHKIQELYNAPEQSPCVCVEENLLECSICNGTKIIPDDSEERIQYIMRYLNKMYEGCPISKTPEDWEVEKLTLFYSLLGYNWYYSDQKELPVIKQELYFRIPIISPHSKRCLPHTVIVGKIDKLLDLPSGNIGIMEHKSTSQSLNQDSTYWKHLSLDTQTLLYAYASERVLTDLHSVPTTLFDVWHKPKIRPRKLSKADLAKIEQTGEYYGQKVEAVTQERETPAMFGARLLDDICNRPEFYFARKEIPRTSVDLEQFEKELFNIYQNVRQMYRTGYWWHNEFQCEAKWKCDFMNFCYNNVEFKEGDIPEGFRCIFNKKEKK